MELLVIARRRLAVVVTAMATVAVPAIVVGTAAPGAAATSLPALPAVAGQISTGSGGGNCVDNTSGIDPAQGSSNGVELATCSGNPGQQIWTVEPNSTIRMTFSYSATRQSNGQQSTGAFECLHTSADSSVQITDCDGSSWEDWIFQASTSGNANEYMLKMSGTYTSGGGGTVTKCLKAPTSTGSPLIMGSCSTSDAAEQWYLPQVTDVTQAAAAFMNLRSDFDKSGGLFVDTASSPVTCNIGTGINYITNTTVSEYGGNCWWWSANSLSAMSTFLQDPASRAWVGSGSLYGDVTGTFEVFCVDPSTGQDLYCPTNTLANQDHSIKNLFQNDWFDDTANWALSWLEAYEYTVSTGSPDAQYLYIAENLWYYITRWGWDHGTNPWTGQPNPFTCGYKGGVINSYQANSPSKTLGVNAMYLRLSAWLYLVTRDTTYRDGISAGYSSDYGGYIQEANWLLPNLAKQTNAITMYNSSTFPNVPLLFANGIDPATCAAGTGPDETQHEGMMLGALAALHDVAVVSASGPNGSLNYSPSFYLTVADNLAQTALTDTAAAGYTGTPMIEFLSNGNAILNESADQNNAEPDNSQPWIIGKGIFMRNLYCVSLEPAQTSTLPDIATFLRDNAASVLQNDENETTNPSNKALNYNRLGYWWQGDPNSPGSLGLLNFAMQTSADDALSASIDSEQASQPSTMC
ncbi:MAG TPA: hypothetical protein VNF47_09450 [Streptosporangiaceae bacterium]|nr:hypothetical protein [Streptosporangiaceae bacterium]